MDTKTELIKGKEVTRLVLKDLQCLPTEKMAAIKRIEIKTNKIIIRMHHKTWALSMLARYLGLSKISVIERA